MSWQDALREQATDFRREYLAGINRRKRITPDQVLAAGGDIPTHEYKKAHDAVVEARMDIQQLPKPDTCPHCFWVVGQRSELKPIPASAERPDNDLFRCDACKRIAEVEYN